MNINYKTIYSCEHCGEKFERESECLMHEKIHEKINMEKEKFLKENPPKVNKGDIVEYYGHVYAVCDIIVKFSTMLDKLYYQYILENSDELDEDNEIQVYCVCDFLDDDMPMFPVSRLIDSETAKKINGVFFNELKKFNVTPKDFIDSYSVIEKKL